MTGTDVLRDELERSGVSGRLFRTDEREKSAVSGIIGHRTEFVHCEQTGQPILLAEVGKSDLSGKLVRRDLLRQSAKAPGRWGLREELVLCAATGRQLLRDETAQSAVSGRWFDRDLLRPSSLSGALARPDEMVTCEESGAIPESFSRLKGVWCIASPSRGIIAACVEVPAFLAFLGRKPRFAGFLVRLREPRALLSRYVVGYRTKDGWVPEAIRQVGSSG